MSCKMQPKRCCGTICIHIYRFCFIAYIIFLTGLIEAAEIQKEGGLYIDKPFRLEEISSEPEITHFVVERSGSEVIKGKSRKKRVTYAQQKLDDEQLAKADATLKGIAAYLKQEMMKADKNKKV